MGFLQIQFQNQSSPPSQTTLWPFPLHTPTSFQPLSEIISSLICLILMSAWPPLVKDRASCPALDWWWESVELYALCQSVSQWVSQSVSPHTQTHTHSWGTGAAGPDEEEIERCGKLPDPTERHNGSARPGGVPQGPRRGVSSSGLEGQKRLLTHCAHESRWKDSLPVAVVFVCVCFLGVVCFF